MKALDGRHILAVIGGTELLGAERGMIQALVALKEAGARITVGVSGRVEQGGAVGQHCRDLGIETFTIAFGSHFAKEWMFRDHHYRNAQLRRLFSNSRLFRQEVLLRQPDALIFGSTLTYAFLALALRRLNTPVVFRVGDAPIVQSRFQMWLWKSLARRSNAIVCISEFIQKKSAPHLPRKKQVNVIRNIAPVRTTALNEAQLETLTQRKRPNQGVYVGQISTQKGVPELVDALIALDDPNTGCWIIGGSRHTKNFEMALKTRVKTSQTKTQIEFIGYLSDPRAHLKVADWHIAPSAHSEALGNVVQEAKAQGTPSLVTPIGGLPETLTHDRTGWILQGVGTKAISEGLYKMQDPNVRPDRQTVLEEAAHMNDAHNFRSRWVSVLQSVLNS